jgi:hypothetical protein
MEVIEELNNIRVKFVFEDEKPEWARKRRATITRSQDSFCSENGVVEVSGNHGYTHHLPPIPNERQTIQNELLRRLEALNDLDPTYVKSIGDDGIPRLGIYTQEERIARINKYREKRKKRVFGKVRYVLRQRASEGRSRVKGRFAKEESDATSTPTFAGREKSVDEMTAVNLQESTSWLEKMSIGVRRLSGQFGQSTRKRSSLPSRPASPMGFDDEDQKGSSWSSWLLKNRRKSSTSAASGKFSDAGLSQSMVPVNPDEADIFLVDHQAEPDRKRLTSGSSALFQEIVFDPSELEAMARDH